MKVVKCAHCGGTGKCKISCGSCAAHSNMNSQQPSGGGDQLVCTACQGAGVQALPQSLTLYDVSETNETERLTDKRKFEIAVAIVVLGFFIFACGIGLAVWKPGSGVQQILFPIGASIISPVAVGYFGQKINISSNKDNEKG